MSGASGFDFYLIKNIAIVSLQAIVVYANTNILFPFLFDRKRYLLYTLSSVILIYLIFSISFTCIDLAFSTFTSLQSEFLGPYFSTDFWRILSGSSFYSLALVCSTIYILFKRNQTLEKDFAKGITDEIIEIKEGKKTHFVKLSDIYFIKGLREYVLWNTKNKNIISLQSLKEIESSLKEKGFIRIHKSYIVNTEHIDSIQSNSVTISKEELPIGRAYKNNLQM
ncbi:LytTR family DNA-binding domain-containing protein [Pseudotenacibaculum sp. MALMAid0570]|uniref:LytR/AlgR family response regulator transcription factor n=1 Tax=Pseudotenacibaculum sp. MALMAid0570 TaxID=3143938 RepID=UPI0032DEF048